MEYHASPPDLDNLPRFRNQMRESLLCAFVKANKAAPIFAEHKISDTKTYYWIVGEDNTEESKNILLKMEDANISEHIDYYASVYSHYTDIPPDKVILVETLELSKTQISTKWEFVERE